MTIGLATEADLVDYLRIRDEAAAWMVSSGIEQWSPGELSEDALREWIGDGDFLAMNVDDMLVGGVIVMWSDPVFWDHATDDDAGYIHGLLVDRQRRTGRGLGQLLLSFAEERIRDEGRNFARLDTVRTNARLNRYYRDAGYVDVGERVFDDGRVLPNGATVDAVTLFEKALSRSACSTRY